MNLLRPILVSVFVATAPICRGADETQPVPRPDVKVGDQWTYKSYGFPGGQGTSEIQVFKVENGNIVAARTDKEIDKESISQFTEEWNPYDLPEEGIVFDRPLCSLKFPMTVGDSWNCTFVQTAKGNDARKFTIHRTNKVLQWEDVVVPAGKLRALKVGFEVRFDTLAGWRGEGFTWYVPEVRRFVKGTVKIWDQSNKLQRDRAFDLLEFKLKE